MHGNFSGYRNEVPKDSCKGNFRFASQRNNQTLENRCSAKRPIKLFFYYGIGEGGEQNEDDGRETGAVIGGETIFGRIAMMRSKLHLSEEEVMNKSWIALCLEMQDFPYYDPKAKRVITGAAADDFLKRIAR